MSLTIDTVRVLKLGVHNFDARMLWYAESSWDPNAERPVSALANRLQSELEKYIPPVKIGRYIDGLNIERKVRASKSAGSYLNVRTGRFYLKLWTIKPQ